MMNMKVIFNTKSIFDWIIHKKKSYQYMILMYVSYVHTYEGSLYIKTHKSVPLESSETFVEKAKWELHKNAKCFFERILKAVSHKMAAVRTLSSYLK